MAKDEVLDQYVAKEIAWTPNRNPFFPFKASVDGKKLLLRIDDFPEESLYTLFVDGQPIGDLDDFPKRWNRVPIS